MKRTRWSVAVGAALAVLAGTAVFAQAAGTTTAAKPANSQQEKMRSCNAEATAKGSHGAGRKSFMSTCLSDQPAAPAKTNSQQEKMKSCNADATAKGLKGADRKTFMSSCLKSSGSEASK
ncbi:MAG TPA: PsiF family protein [Steroidobacteraceae bacterium]|nr:PsiF family protein [Steroidobacteraceae bacterium]